MAWLYVITNCHFFGLGWAVRLGPILLPSILILGLVEIRNTPIFKTFQVVVLFEAAILFEYVGIPPLLSGFVSIGCVLLGETILLSHEKMKISKAIWLLFGSYIESVFIYNTLLPGQMMFFFKPGWTA